MRAVRGHTGYWAFVVHRVSGVALAIFLPAHFWVLGTALRGEAALDGALRWTEQPLVVAGEWLLVIALAAHLAGGLRLLALELLPWRNWQKTLATLAAAVALVAGLVFALAR
jgi:fumarate reductase subunit D